MAVAATGFFDGVHLGHREVIKTLVSAAHRRSDESLVVTFWPHPRAVLQKDAAGLRLLTSLEDKKKMLEDLGVDRVEVLPFTKEFGRLTTSAYLKEVLKERFGAGSLVLGYDNSIGSDLLTPERTAGEASALGLDVLVVPPVIGGDGEAVSSTRIRWAVASGGVEYASEMLGWNYSLKGAVVSGNRIGRTIGFPTANMQLYEPRLMVPAAGVYSVQVYVDGVRYQGMTNIGVRPTVGENGNLTIETHIFGFDEDIYGLDIRICFLRRIREERRFASLGELAAQLCRDREACLSQSADF